MQTISFDSKKAGSVVFNSVAESTVEELKVPEQNEQRHLATIKEEPKNYLDLERSTEVKEQLS